MKRTARGHAAIIVIVLIAVAAGAALLYWRSEPATTVRPNEPAGARGSDGVVSESAKVSTPAPASTPAPVVATPPAKAPAPPANGTPPAPPPPDVKFPYSYLAGRTPSEVRPDGTQVFKDVPFQVKQPDGTMKTVPSTITIQPAPAPLPVKEDG